MTVIAVLDGPEKAGKSTLAQYLAENFSKIIRTQRFDFLEVPHSTVKKVDKVMIRHWHGQIPSISVYLAALIADTETEIPVIWDRSWASEAIYSGALDRPDRGNKHDWFSTEWYYGRAIQTTGLRIMVLGQSVELLQSRRTPDDLPVEPLHERNLFSKYANQFNWIPASGGTDQYTNLLEAVAVKHEDYIEFQSHGHVKPPAYCGPIHPKVVVLGERLNESAPDPSWLPFTSSLTMHLGRELLPYSFQCGWTNVATAPVQILSKATLIVACGYAASYFVSKLHLNAQIYSCVHPSAFYRWSRYSQVREEVESELRLLISSIPRGTSIS